MIELYAVTAMKIPMVGFEISFLGLMFSLLRTLLSIPVFLLIAWIMKRFFGKNFVMYDVVSKTS